MSTYLEFEISRSPSGYLARRRRKTEIHLLGPRRTMAEIKRRIDEFYFETPVEEW